MNTVTTATEAKATTINYIVEATTTVIAITAGTSATKAKSVKVKNLRDIETVLN